MSGPNGTVQEFDHDAYGNLISDISTQNLATTLLYSGEVTDIVTGQQYLRARYYDPQIGRFNSLDPFIGNASDPQSLHKYGYVHGDPIQGVDPSVLLVTQAEGFAAEEEIELVYRYDHPECASISNRVTNYSFGKPVGFGLFPSYKPDILNNNSRRFAEIKPLTLEKINEGSTQLEKYQLSLAGNGYFPDDDWNPSTNLIFLPRPAFFINVAGLVLYTPDLQLKLLLATATSLATIRVILNTYSFSSAAAAIQRMSGLVAGFNSGRASVSGAVAPIGGIGVAFG